jgi:hypothetical protein
MRDNCESCHESYSTDNLAKCVCGRDLCYSCLARHQVMCKIKHGQINMLDIFDAAVDAQFTQTIEQHPAVAKYTSKTNAEVYKGNVFLLPDWRLYEFHIPLLHYKQCFMFRPDKQQSIDAFVNYENANITKLNQPALRDSQNTVPFFSLPSLDWQLVPTSETAVLMQAFHFYLRDVEPKGEIRFLSTPLSFYANSRLIAVHSTHFKPAQKWMYFLEAKPINGNTQYYTLNGLSAPIHDCNKILPIKINKDNVLDYLCFFCFFLQSEDGSFYVIPHIKDPALPDFIWKETYIHNNKALDLATLYKPPRLIESTEDGFLCEATMYCGNSLSTVEIEVDTTGMCTIKNSVDHCSTLPYRLEISLG